MLSMPLLPRAPAQAPVHAAAGSSRMSVHAPGDPGRAAVEDFIRGIYRERYGADVRQFARSLVSLHDDDGELLAAAGYRAADHSPLFLERYLGVPVEMRLAAGSPAAPARSRIVEVGHLAAGRAGEGRRLVMLLGPHLAGEGFQWVVGTLTEELRHLLLRLGIAPLPLGVADPAMLGDEAAALGQLLRPPPDGAGRQDRPRPEVAGPSPHAGMRPALDDGCRRWDAAELDGAVLAASRALREVGARVLATVLDNTPAFVVLDEALLRCGCVHVPLPLFFTPAQMRHALQAAGVDTLVTTAAQAARWSGPDWVPLTVAGIALMQARLRSEPVALPPGTAKITFTSGTTGAPKGVCLSGDAMGRVSRALVDATAPLGITRHLNALPFSVLLENVAGLMAPRLHGATVVTLPLQQVGLAGSSSFDAALFQSVVQRQQPHSLILLPQMLRAWCGHLMQSAQRAPASLKLVAVGGAAVGAPLIHRARALGIPACEGYGLSEGASVQTLNLPEPAGGQRPGSAGRVLPHARLRVAADGELEIAGSLFSGYLGDATPVPEWWPTGDLGRIDDDGFVHVLGRKKHVLITSYGRNVSPEWVETALRGQPAVLQAVVFGDGQPALSAVLWPLSPVPSDAALQAAVDAANVSLPDYARIGRWTRGRAAFDAATGLATANGRPQRDAVWRAHADALHRVSATPHPEPRTHELSSPTPRTDRRCPPGPARHAHHPGRAARRGLAAQLPGLPARGLPPRAAHGAPAAGLQAACRPRMPGWRRRWRSTSRRRQATTSGSSTTSAPAAATPRPCAAARPATPPR